MSEPVEATFPRVIDATMRSEWNTCDHLFFRRHCQGLVSNEQTGVDLHYGACLAKGLEVTRRKWFNGTNQSVAVCDGADALLKQWGAYEFNPRTKNQEQKSLDNCLLALADYFKQWPLDYDPIKIHVHEGEPCIEFSGAREIPNTEHPDTGEPVVYSGRFDLIGDYEGSNWGLDDKTGPTSTTPDKWRLRGQFTGYCWLAQEYGLPLTGFLVREIQPLTNSIKFNQVITPRPRWMIDAWLRQLQADVYQMTLVWHKYKHWEESIGRSPYPDAVAHPHPFGQDFDNGCMAFNKACQFMPLCSSPEPEKWLNSYRVDRWNPLVGPTR